MDSVSYTSCLQPKWTGSPPKLNLFSLIFHRLSPPQRWSVFLHQRARLWEPKRAPSHPEHGGQRPPPPTNCLLASSLILNSLILLNHDILRFLSAFRSCKPISCGSLCQTSQRRLRLLIRLLLFTVFWPGLAQKTWNKLQCVLRSETELPSTIQTWENTSDERMMDTPTSLPGVHRCKNVNSFKLSANDFPHIPRIPPLSAFTSVRSTVPASCAGSNGGDKPSEMNAFQLLLRLLFLGFCFVSLWGSFYAFLTSATFTTQLVNSFIDRRQRWSVQSHLQHAFASVETASLALSKGNNIRLPAPLLYFI